MDKSDDISLYTQNSLGGQIGCICLKRPQQLNALNPEMVHRMYQQLLLWRDDDAIVAVLITASPGRAFCAGGDLRYLHQLLPENRASAQKFFADEYRLNHLIAHFPKPYIALLDGITMGGGVGISIHGSLRIATENLQFAMPETGIGFFPDVGSSYVLSRLPQHFGYYLALSGIPISAADALTLGLVDCVVSSQDQNELVQSLLKTQIHTSSDNTLKQMTRYLATRSPTSRLATIAADVERCFSQPSLEAIFKALESTDTAWSRQTLATLNGRSPTSLCLTMKLLQMGGRQDLTTCMQMEYRLAYRLMASHDFREGVRAAIIDKDKQPRYKPDTIAGVSEADIDAYFAPLGRYEWHSSEHDLSGE